MVAHPTFEVGSQVGNTSPPSGAFTPTQIRQAYGFNKIAFGAVQGDGTGQTIAIVDAMDDPNIQADLDAFDTQFGLPNVTVNRVNQSGGTSYPASDSSGGWELEISLDVEWAHAIAPGAQILLVEANSANDADLLAGVIYAASHASVVSMSWGGSEFDGETSYDSSFSQPGVSYVASSGDYGAPIMWPASSPNVLSVGGTALSVGASGLYASETGWGGSGGGPSAYESRPTYQNGVVTQTTMRANPDVSYDASPYTGFAVYDSVPSTGNGTGWLQVGGTSAGAPQWAALLAIADQGRALSGQSALNSSNPQEVMTTLYKNGTTGLFHDVTSGTSTGTPNYSASAGYDYVTGLGSPLADRVVQVLGGTVAPPASIDQLAVAASPSQTAGAAFNVTITAQNTNGTDSSYRGTVHFSTSDVQAGLPANYTYTASDAGSHTFSLTLKTAGSQSVSAVDTVSVTTSGSLTGIAVSPATASQFVLSGLASSTTAGNSQTITVTARDAYGNLATGYTGTVRFTTGDTQAILPAAYTFTTADRGVHTFGLTFQTAGSQSLTIGDTAGGPTATQSGISVTPAAAINLTAVAASTSQLNLAWTGSTGDTGYMVERSANGSNGWNQIGTTALGTTSYADSGLVAGTTYYYRVRTSVGGLNSAYTATVSATTKAAVVVAVTDTIWSNSTTPTVNSYTSGTYDLGVKFRTDVAGTVTGARFYKQTWMSGSTHVGYLWSTTGTMLASATFTGETASGWQNVTFSSPVAVAANTVYIVSYSSGGGNFGITTNYFDNSGVDNGPLHALSNGVSGGGGGVYGYGNSVFPGSNGYGMNFWADVAFSPSASSPAVSSPSVSIALKVGSSNQRTNSDGIVSPNVVPAGPVSAWSQTPTRHDVTVPAGWWSNRRTVRTAMVATTSTKSAFGS